jgi:hypothetical protein
MTAPAPTDHPAARLGIQLIPRAGEPLTDLVVPALRRNPRRAHLLVSTVLGKHLPADPRVVRDAGRRLGAQVRQRLDGAAALVIGYAETATALGHCVADALGADYLHSTRRRVAGVRPTLAFTEPHSHATDHLLMPERPAMLWGPGVIVLVDDELSTATTALNTIVELHRLVPRRRYVIAALVDLRGPGDRARMRDVADQLGTTVDVVALAEGIADVPDGLPAQVGAAHPETRWQRNAGFRLGALRAVPVVWPADVPEGGRHGVCSADTARMRRAAERQAAALAPAGPRVLVLGTEELMYAPLLIAEALADRRPDLIVRLSSTTRSPVVVVDEPGYPIRTALQFAAPDFPGERRFAYNVTGEAGFDDVVVVLDRAAADGAADLLAQLQSAARRVHAVALPERRPVSPPALHGPAFGSYAADEVSWLLTDLSAVDLEAPVADREREIQAGRAHYAESLPIEYQPSPEYRELFAAALDASAGRVARAVGVVTELLLDERGPDMVLASLARAGTPVGILIRRWAREVHGLSLPHYAVSIVRGRGIDAVALRALAARHDPAAVVFVDGWTGKGAIARELGAAIAATDPRFSPDLAVLADTGHCVTRYGTRDDFLIPSACLNATVSGLVSRTVLNDRVLRPGQYHGAKFYAELAENDVSAVFLDRVSAEFGAVRDVVEREWRRVQRSDRRPTWRGWTAVEQIAAEYGISDVNLVKPGVGETTRVLLRRVPWRVLVRPGAEVELAHVLLLARQRGVAVEEVPDLGYSCVGLIHPRFGGKNREQ